jgi:hypothetical protein
MPGLARVPDVPYGPEKVLTSPSITALPREIEADPGHEAIRAQLAAPDRLLWRGGQARVPVLPLSPTVAAALAAAAGAGHLVLGFERVAKALAAETHGLALVAGRGGSTRRARISRLLLLSDDGAERLYRHAEGLMVAHAPRVLVAVLAADAAALGHATAARDAAVKVVLVKHKQAVAALMRALAG